MNNHLFEQYRVYEETLEAYSYTGAMASFDMNTIMTAKSMEHHRHMASILQGEAFSYRYAPENISMLQALSKEENLDSLTRKGLRYHLRQYGDMMHVPKEESVSFMRLAQTSYGKWAEAKQAQDYSILAPHMQRLIDQQKKMIAYRNSDKSCYDLLLDDNEPEMNITRYDAFFDELKGVLVPLRKAVEAKKKHIDRSFLFGHFPKEQQRAFVSFMQDYLGFDKEAGLFSTTEHPFCSGIDVHNVRFTVNFHEDYLASAIFGCIHEMGHALYEQQCDPKYQNTIVRHEKTAAMHEAQSRMYENMFGRSSALWDVCYPKLQSLFPSLQEITQKQFVDAINATQSGYSRIEADELTYPIHILIRYEIEKELFNGNLSAEDCKERWNQKYAEYLSVTPQNDSEGILQDMHWSNRYYGYFPTYALGSAYAAQIVHAMRKEIDIESALRTNHMDQINAWLKKHIHQHSGFYTVDELMTMATGQVFTPSYYTSYLKEKYTALYEL